MSSLFCSCIDHPSFLGRHGEGLVCCILGGLRNVHPKYEVQPRIFTYCSGSVASLDTHCAIFRVDPCNHCNPIPATTYAKSRASHPIIMSQLPKSGQSVQSDTCDYLAPRDNRHFQRQSFYMQEWQSENHSLGSS